MKLSQEPKVGQQASFAVQFLRNGYAEAGKLYGHLTYVDDQKVVIEYWDPELNMYLKRGILRPFQPRLGVEIYEH
jgi:general stress protein 26